MASTLNDQNLMVDCLSDQQSPKLHRHRPISPRGLESTGIFTFNITSPLTTTLRVSHLIIDDGGGTTRASRCRIREQTAPLQPGPRRLPQRITRHHLETSAQGRCPRQGWQAVRNRRISIKTHIVTDPIHPAAAPAPPPPPGAP